MFFYGMSPAWLLLMLVSTVLGLVTRGYITSTFAKWSRVPLSSGMTGAEVARRVMDSNGLGQLPIAPTPGALTDHYDPRNKMLRRLKAAALSGFYGLGYPRQTLGLLKACWHGRGQFDFPALFLGLRCLGKSFDLLHAHWVIPSGILVDWTVRVNHLPFFITAPAETDVLARPAGCRFAVRNARRSIRSCSRFSQSSPSPTPPSKA